MVKRVLVTGATKIGEAGLSNIVFEWGQHFDDTELTYDFLIRNGPPARFYFDKIIKKGGRVLSMPENSPKNIINSLKWTLKAINDNKYDTIHINASDALVSAYYVFIAKKSGISHIYVHSHSSELDIRNPIKRRARSILHRLCRPYIKKNAELCLACSNLAADWMYGKSETYKYKYCMISNGVKCQKYFFDEKTRIVYKRELGLDNKKVIGNIGRLSYQKNQEFLVDIFSEIVKHEKNIVLMIAGSGEDEPKLKEKVKQLDLEKNVMFIGQRDDIPQLLWVMDVLVMPSRFEGLPITLIEAQMASLPCFVSDNVTKEAKITDNVNYVGTTDVHIWCDLICEALRKERDITDTEILLNNKFNIENATRELQSILMGKMKANKK